MPTVFILNGPNLNLLGVREPATYGYDTLADVEQRCLARAAALDLAIEFRQTNHEGQLVDWIHEAREAADGIIINAGAFTHTSVAILDALNAADLPVCRSSRCISPTFSGASVSATIPMSASPPAG